MSIKLDQTKTHAAFWMLKEEFLNNPDIPL